MPRRLWTATGVLTILLACPHVARAGIIEILAEMSGPQMIGLLIECRVTTDASLDQCTAVGVKVAGQSAPPPRRIWFSMEGGAYFSTGKNASGQDYEAGKVFMLAFDPMIEIQTVTKPKFAMYHGVMGASYNFLFGSEFRKFANVAFKLRPIGVIVNNRVNVAYNLRLYPNGFTSDQFGKLPIAPEDNKPEVVHGVSIGVRF